MLDSYKDVFINSGSEDTAAFFFKITGEIGSAAK
jgi:hypothetical protein